MTDDHSSLPQAWEVPPRRVLMVAEATAALTWLLLMWPQVELHELSWQVPVAIAASQLLLLPTLFHVWRSAMGRSPAALAFRLWIGTVLSGYLLIVVATGFMAAMDETVGVGIGVLLLGLLTGGIAAAACSVVFGPAIWLTAMAIEFEARRVWGEPSRRPP